MVEHAFPKIANCSKLSVFSHLNLVIYTARVFRPRPPSVILGTYSNSIRTPYLRQVAKLVAEQKTVKDHTLLLKLKKHSDIVKFILQLRSK